MFLFCYFCLTTHVNAKRRCKFEIYELAYRLALGGQTSTFVQNNLILPKVNASCRNSAQVLAKRSRKLGTSVSVWPGLKLASYATLLEVFEGFCIESLLRRIFVVYLSDFYLNTLMYINAFR